MGIREDFTIRSFIICNVHLKHSKLLNVGDEDIQGNVHIMEESWSSFKISTGKPTGNTLLRKPRHRWKGNISLKK